MILVDSSIWIAAWRGPETQVKDKLGYLIENGEVVINFLIRTELLQGAKDRSHQQTLIKLLSPIPVISFLDKLWNEAPSLYLKSREHGITLTTIDCLIAAHAILMNISLWSLDQVFQKIKGLKLIH